MLSPLFLLPTSQQSHHAPAERKAPNPGSLVRCRAMLQKLQLIKGMGWGVLHGVHGRHQSTLGNCCSCHRCCSNVVAQMLLKCCTNVAEKMLLLPQFYPKHWSQDVAFFLNVHLQILFRLIFIILGPTLPQQCLMLLYHFIGKKKKKISQPLYSCSSARTYIQINFCCVFSATRWGVLQYSSWVFFQMRIG